MKAKLTKKVVDSLEVKDKLYDVHDTQIHGFLLRIYPSGRLSFYFSYRNIAKKRNRIMLGVYGAVSIQQARDKALKCASQVSDGIDPQEEKAKTKQQKIVLESHTLEAFLDKQYAPWIIENQKSGQATLNTLNSSFEEMMSLAMSNITHALVDQWRTTRSKKGLKPATINRCVNALRGALSRAVEWQVIPDHPFKGLKDLKIDKRPKVRYLSEEESERLMKALDVRDDELKQARKRGNQHREERGYELMPDLMGLSYADRMTPLILVSLKTGMRRGELFDLEWNNVDFVNSHITVIGDDSKTSHTRHIPLNALALKTLKKWRKQAPCPNGRLFPADDKGGRLDNVRKSWDSILKAAKIEHFRWHDMRHDFASQLVMKGVPLNTVRELCGHSSMDTTLRYAHLAPDHKSEAVALI